MEEERRKGEIVQRERRKNKVRRIHGRKEDTEESILGKGNSVYRSKSMGT